MKTLAFIIMLALALEASADHPSVHGMLVVGKDKIYLSHLPMFHSPHDYQVILEAEIPADAKKTYLLSKQRHNEPVYTLVPETFVLPDMVKNPKPFKAQLYRGHFERGGVPIVTNLTVNIKQVVHFKKFSPTATRPQKGQYLAFGDGAENFLAHVITSKPNFDQIVQLDDNVAEGQLSLNVDDKKPLEQGKTYTNGEFQLRIKESIYLEFSDLSH